MNLRGKILCLASVSAVAAGTLLIRSGSSAPRNLEAYRHFLRQQGFKIELSEFNFSQPADVIRRTVVLTNFGSELTYDLARQYINLMQPIDSSSALPIWKTEQFLTQSREDLWPALSSSLARHKTTLDAASESALSGPLGVPLNPAAGMAMLLPHLASFKTLANTLSSRALLELHEHDTPAAWRDLLAVSRLVTAWEPESTEISHLVRFACMTIAYNLSWQVLQAGGWNEEQLAALQHEWEGVNFFQHLPDTAAFARASAVYACQQQRLTPPAYNLSFSLVKNPAQALPALSSAWSQYRYRHHGTYEDEQALLLFYQDAELNLRAAIHAASWARMRELPGVTNALPFRSKYSSPIQSMLNLRSVSTRAMGQSLLSRAADAEARRRLLITALALTRYSLRHGAFPNKLSQLVPEILTQPPLDFMDGQPLRYSLQPSNRFLLYSCGLDCLDNGGKMKLLRSRDEFTESSFFPGPTAPQDLVWPIPGSIEAFAQEQQAKATRAELALEQRRAALETERRSRVAALLSKPPPGRKVQDPLYKGHPLSALLQNQWTLGTNHHSLDDLLTLKQVPSGREPDFVSFELPISYHAATNIAAVLLLIDPAEDFSEEFESENVECTLATNGNCLLTWNTSFDTYGQHALQAALVVEEKEEPVQLLGPMVPFFSTNICQFDPAYARFNPAGATLFARLPESNSVYQIELKSPDGVLLKTFSGTTSNGVIKHHWDLVDDHGQRYTNNAFDGIFHITLPDSGRSQTSVQ